MTRFERIQAHLREVGPRSTKQIAEHFGWKMNTASGAVCHARSYGYIKAHSHYPTPNRGGSPMTIWQHREGVEISSWGRP